MAEARRIPINRRPAAAERSSAAAGPTAGAPRAAAAGGPARTGATDPLHGSVRRTAAASGGEAGTNGQATTGDPATAAPEGSAAETIEEALPSTGEVQLEAELEALRHERDVLADRELRLRAEFENFRKRASREAMELRERAQGQLLSELLPVLDNLERALDAAEHHDEGKVLGGVRMTRDMFVELLRRAGVEEIETVGVAFDPHVHEAVVMQPSKDKEGTITAVLERGYRQGDRVLRPARVVVSSGSASAGRRE